MSLRNGPPDPADLAGRDAIVHLAGENVAQRWSDERPQGDPRVARAGHAPARRRDRPGRPEAARADQLERRRLLRPARRRAARRGRRRPATTSWPRCASSGSARPSKAAELGLRVVKVRTGVVLDAGGGALSKMLLPFKLGGGGPVAGGRQYMPWIHVDDVVGIYLRAIDDPAWEGPVNATAPEPVTNRTFSKALGKALHRPAVAPIPGAAIRLLYGDMAEIVTKGQRVDPEAHDRARLHVSAPRSRRGARGRRGLSAPKRKTEDDIRTAEQPSLGRSMGDLPPDLDRLGLALTHATERAVTRRRPGQPPPPAAGRLRRGRVLRVRVDDAHPPRARRPAGLLHAGDRAGRRRGALRHAARAALPLHGRLHRAAPAAAGRALSARGPQPLKVG